MNQFPDTFDWEGTEKKIMGIRQVRSSPDSNPFCGPAALSVLTGCHVDECVKWCEAEVGNSGVKGLFYPTLLKILKERGFNYERVSYSSINRDGDFLVVWQGHFGAFCNGTYYDNSCKNGEPIILRYKMVAVFKIERGTAG